MSGAQPEERVATPMLVQQWVDVVFLHWPVDPSVLATSPPKDLTVDTYEGAAWLTLTPFRVEGARPAFLPPVPVVSSFIESNVRTDVIGPDGRDGLWFFTLETDSLPTTIAARTLLSIPCRWASMGGCRRGDLVTYSSRRRLGVLSPGHHTTVATGRTSGVADVGLAGWLTGRWRAWTRVAGRLLTVPVEHESWPLTDATVAEHKDTLLTSFGLPTPTAEPIVHTASGVTARFGWPQSLDGGRENDRPRRLSDRHPGHPRPPCTAPAVSVCSVSMSGRRTACEATVTDPQPDAGHDRPSRSSDRDRPADDPDAPGAFVDDEEAAEVPEPNEPA